MTEQSFFHAGDLGDVIAALPTVRQLGGGRIVIGPGPCRESMRGARFESIKTLLERQPYVRGVQWSEEKPSEAWDFSTFRHDLVKGESLAHWQARHIGLPSLNTEPWLSAPAAESHIGAVIFARSTRYENGYFPWFDLLKRYPDAIFLGNDEEHSLFSQLHLPRKRLMPRVRVSSLWDMARLLAGAKLFCGNQSCPWWIACGLGVTTFQETWWNSPDSMIERPNAFYMTEKEFDLSLLPE